MSNYDTIVIGAGPTSSIIGLETTVEELARTVHHHPTLSEVMMDSGPRYAG